MGYFSVILVQQLKYLSLVPFYVNVDVYYFSTVNF